MANLTTPPTILPGDMILLDSRGMGCRLFPCDDWDAAEFRLEGITRSTPALAVNVEVTGRGGRKVPGGGWGWRVRVTFVGDCEPDVTTAGWVYENTAEGRARNLRAAGFPVEIPRPYSF